MSESESEVPSEPKSEAMPTGLAASDSSVTLVPTDDEGGFLVFGQLPESLQLAVEPVPYLSEDRVPVGRSVEAAGCRHARGLHDQHEPVAGAHVAERARLNGIGRAACSGVGNLVAGAS